MPFSTRFGDPQKIDAGTLVRIVQAWAKRGWKLTGVLYNVVTTYDRVSAHKRRKAFCVFFLFTKSARNEVCRHDWLIECVTALQVALDEPDIMHGAIQSTVSKSLFAVSPAPRVCGCFNFSQTLEALE